MNQIIKNEIKTKPIDVTWAFYVSQMEDLEDWVEEEHRMSLNLELVEE